MAHTRHAQPPAPSAPAPEAPPPILRYVLNRATVGRDLQAYELFLLLDRVMGPIELSVPADDAHEVAPDLRRHMRPVRGE